MDSRLGSEKARTRQTARAPTLRNRPHLIRSPNTNYYALTNFSYSISPIPSTGGELEEEAHLIRIPNKIYYALTNLLCPN